MSQVTMKIATEADFFRRGREIARLVDHAEPLPEEYSVSFEDPAEMLKLLTAGRLALLRMLKEHPASIAQLAQRLHRHRGAIKRDVDALARYGLVAVESAVSSGRGRTREIHLRANRLRLEASID